MKKCSVLLLGLFALVLSGTSALAQNARQRWADSVLQSLTFNEQIAQLIVIRTSSMDAQGNPVIFAAESERLVSEYNVGAVCLFQGTPQQHATLLNSLQQKAKTPVMVTVDGEWGLGMRFAGVKSYPYQLTMGAMQNAALVYEVGKAIADQCRRMNIHVNYAPVVDVNNNAANPVIGVRSFGEDKYKVALMGTRIMQGMQQHGVMACAKHFPGHGDVSVDSHYDLPLISKSRAQLNDLELYPFKALFNSGVGSVMVAHLAIPAIDSTPNQPTSLSPKNIIGVMREELDYQGLTFTDALEMKGVAKFYPGGEAAVQSLVAGNDMLCLPEDVAKTIEAVNMAIASGRLTTAQIADKCRRVLLAKYDYVLGRTGAIATQNLTEDLNQGVDSLRRAIALKAFTVVKGEPAYTQPLNSNTAYLAIGTLQDSAFENMLEEKGVALFRLPRNADGSAAQLVINRIKQRTPLRLIVGLHGYTRSATNRFGISDGAWQAIAAAPAASASSQLLVMGNPYALGLAETSGYTGIAIGYEDDAVFREVEADWLQGKFTSEGRLPVTIGAYPVHAGVRETGGLPASARLLPAGAQAAIDQIAAEAIAQKATPGCVVMVAHNGSVIFNKAYGYYTYEQQLPMTNETIFDMASVTKTSATTMAVMKLWEEGKLHLHDTLGKHLPWLRGTDKQGLYVKNLLLHQAGLNAYIPFYREADELQRKGTYSLFSRADTAGFQLPVSNTVYMHSPWADTMYSRIATSTLVKNKLDYVYSDNDFILLGKIVESISEMPLDQYVLRNFYEPLGMYSTGFRAAHYFPLNTIAPTEQDGYFRRELVWGFVHDPGAAMFGNVAGHAGLFSNASDLATLYQMVLNGGHYGGKSYFKKATVDYFTSYQTPISRRGLGFDKPEKNNKTLAKPYPATYVSPATFGHTGFTGTCVWADPAHNLVYIFLSNRVHPDGENRKLLDLNIRGRIHDAVYAGLGLAN